jgi:hypothetical protein
MKFGRAAAIRWMRWAMAAEVAETG